jgi:tetratricopeptide (TPR) repeat protein
MYQRAVQLDSSFALAYAMLSRGHASMYWEFYDRSTRRRELAWEAATTALHLDAGLVESHLAMGYYFYHCELDYESAMAQFETALRIQPSNSDLLNASAAVQRRQGLLQASVESFKKALSLDPSSHLKAFDVALTYGMMRDFTQANRWLDRTITLAPDWPLPHIYKAWLQILAAGDKDGAREILTAASSRCDLSRSKYYWWLARIVEPDYRQVLAKTAMGTDSVSYYLHVARINRLLGNYQVERAYSDTVRGILEKRVQTEQEEARYHSDLGLAFTGLRDKEKALEHGRRAVELLPTTKEAFDAPFLIMNLAESLVVLGEQGEAVRMLEKLLSIPGFVSAHYLRPNNIRGCIHANQHTIGALAELNLWIG